MLNAAKPKPIGYIDKNTIEKYDRSRRIYKESLRNVKITKDPGEMKELM